MEKVRETGVPIKTAARQFGLPGSSLRHKLSGRVGSNPFRPQPILSIQEEHHFVQHIKFMSEWFQSSFRKAGIYPLNPDIVHRPTSSHQKLFNKKPQKTHNSTTMQFLLPATLSYFARRSQPNQKTSLLKRCSLWKGHNRTRGTCKDCGTPTRISQKDQGTNSWPIPTANPTPACGSARLWFLCRNRWLP